MMTGLAPCPVESLVHDRAESCPPAMGDMPAMPTGAVVEIADSVLAHGQVSMTGTGEHIFVPARQRPHGPQHGHRFGRKRHKVVKGLLVFSVLHQLHLCGGDVPEGVRARLILRPIDPLHICPARMAGDT